MKARPDCLPAVAQVFPLNPGPGTVDAAHQALARTLAGLPEEWTLLRQRQIGETPVDVVLVHPGIGVALVDLAPQSPEAAAEALRARLEGERFAEFFPGELPIVAVSLEAAEIEAAGDRLAAAFEAAPLLAIGDADWADAVIELLLLPDDLAMVPTGPFATPPDALSPPQPPLPEPAPRPAFGEASAAPTLEPTVPPEPPVAAPRPLLLDRPTAPLRLEAEEPIAYGPPEPRRRRGWIAGVALAGLVVAGVLFAWSLSGSETPEIGSPGTGEAQIALPPALPTLAPEAAPEASRAKAEPPALPPAPPVMMAARAMAAPPPAAPRPTAVPPLPAPEAAAAAPPPAAPVPEATAAATPPAAPAEAAPPAPAPAKTKTRREARAEKAAEAKPRRVARTETEAPGQLMRRELGSETAETGQVAPPIDAADLPPLEGPSQPPPPPAAAPAPVSEAPPAPAIGPPLRLTRQTAVTAQAAADRRDCRPYTADTTLTGRSVAVQGMACRDSDGQWRLVSEVPQQ